MDAHARGRHAAGPPGPVPTPARDPVRAQPALPPVPGYDATAAAALLRLQREYGNAGVQRLVAGDPPATSALIVEDAVTELAEGQLRRGEFLLLLRSSVGAALAAAGPLAEASGRDQLDQALAGLDQQDAAGVERSLRQNLPGATVTDARSFATAAAAAVSARAAEQSTPEAAIAVATGAVGAAVSTVARGVASAVSAVGSVLGALFKPRDGSTPPAADPHALRGHLGAGQALDGGVRTGMETAYGQDFSGVRVHTDGAAAGLSGQLGARAFTLGGDIAFGAGEYRPGTALGDALIAHELAHVVQQGGTAGQAPLTGPVAGLEEEADQAAAGALVARSVEGGPVDPALLPRLRAGLRIQRCAAGAAQQHATTPALTPAQWQAAVAAAGNDPAARTALVQQAVADLGITVGLAGTSNSSAVVAADYAETPVLNFDPLLNQKTRHHSTTAVGTNVGYNFTEGAHHYAILGPSAITDTPLTARQYAQHELSLVAATAGPGQNNDDLELAQWTADFRGYFHQYMPLPHRPTWSPLIQYYDRAHPADRTRARQQLVDYYNHPPVAADQVDHFHGTFRNWMRRASGQLIDDLNGALPSP